MGCFYCARENYDNDHHGICVGVCKKQICMAGRAVPHGEVCRCACRDLVCRKDQNKHAEWEGASTARCFPKSVAATSLDTTLRIVDAATTGKLEPDAVDRFLNFVGPGPKRLADSLKEQGIEFVLADENDLVAVKPDRDLYTPGTIAALLPSILDNLFDAWRNCDEDDRLMIFNANMSRPVNWQALHVMAEDFVDFSLQAAPTSDRAQLAYASLGGAVATLMRDVAAERAPLQTDSYVRLSPSGDTIGWAKQSSDVTPTFQQYLKARF